MHRPEWYAEASRGKSVLEMVGDVSSICRGAYDTSVEELENNVKCLKQVLEDWKDSPPDHIGYIFNVSLKELIKAALDMFKTLRGEIK